MDRGLLGKLLSELSDGEADCREAAASGLVRLGEPAIPGVCSVALKGPPLAQAAAMKVLAALASPQAVERLARVPGFEFSDELNARIRVLAACGPPAAAELVRALSIDDSAAWIAAMALRRMGVEAVPALCDGVFSRYVRGAVTSARLLGAIGHPFAVEPLARAAVNAVPEVSAEAALALGQLGCAEARTALRKAAADPERGATAAIALIELGETGDGLIPHLVHALRSHDARVRVRAARALERMATDEAPLALRSALTPLGRLARSWLIDGDERSLYRRAAERIRGATAGLADLPVPGTVSSAGSLPLPAQMAQPDPGAFPLPVGEPDPEPRPGGTAGHACD